MTIPDFYGIIIALEVIQVELRLGLMVSNLKRVVLLVVVTLAVCQGGRCEAGILGVFKKIYREKLAMLARSKQAPIAAKPGTSYTNIHNLMRRKIDLSGLGLNTTFADAIDILRNSTEPPLNIIVMWRDLSQNTYIERDTPIMMEGIEGIKAGHALELLLSAVSSRSGRLGYAVQGGAVIITSTESLPARRFARVYDISDLVARPANFGYGFGAYPVRNRMFGSGQMNSGRWGGGGDRINYSRRTTRRR